MALISAIGQDTMGKRREKVGDLVAVSDDGVRYTIGWITKISNGIHYTVQWSDDSEEYPMQYIPTDIQQLTKTYKEYCKYHG